MEKPNQTLYIRNLNEKIKQTDLKKQLYQMFSQFGYVLDIVCVKNFKMRGQAFVVFESINIAVNAMNTMQGFIFYDKPMQIQFAKSKSDAVAVLDGSYNHQIKKERAERRMQEFDQLKKKQKQGQEDSNEQKLRKLQVSDFPEEISVEALEELFNQYSGFQNLQIRENVAIVEYASEKEAMLAKAGLNNFNLTQKNKLSISMTA